jgi:tetratricopeptide (TPR) repeat protein
VLRLRAEFDKLNGDHESALAAYRRILELDPEAVDIHNLQGYLYLSMGEYEKAVQSLQRYAFYAPDQANPHDSLGEAFLFTGRYEEAVREFVRALEIDPGFVWSAVHLSDALSVIGQFERAREVLAKIEPIFVERNWTDWMVMQRMRIGHRAEQWDEVLRIAEEELAKRTSEGPADELTLWLQFSRVVSLLELGELAKAERVVPELQSTADSFMQERSQYATVKDAARLNEALVRARFGRAKSDPESGLQELREAIGASRLSPHELSSYRVELAENLLAAGRPDEALEVTYAHLRVIPTSPSMNLVAARACVELGRNEQALEHLQVFLEVMRSADEGHPRVTEARRMLQLLVPRS